MAVTDGQTISYDGIPFEMTQVAYEGRAVYDTSGRTLQGHELMFRVQAWVVGTGTPNVDGITKDGDQSNFEQKIKAIISHLHLSRKRFIWKVGDTVLWDIGTNGSGAATEDRRFGPKPQNIRVEHVTRGRSAKISFEVACFVSLCAESKPVEEFWMTFGYSFDRNFVCTRTVTGRIRYASKYDAPLGFLTQSDLWPKLPDGFYRDNMSHSMSADGTTIDFSVSDRQVWRTLPKPLTNGDATFRVSVSGMILTKTLNCSFEAPNNVNKQIILQFIIALCKARFPFLAGGAGDPLERITNFSITNHEFVNRVEASITTTMSADALMGANGSINQLGWLLGDVAEVTPPPGDLWTQSNGQSELRPSTGTAGLVPQPTADFDTCTTAFAYPEQQKLGDTAGRQDSDAEGSPFDPDDNGDSIFTEDHVEYPYTSYHEHWQYIIDRHLVVLKPAKKDVPGIIQRTSEPSGQIIQVGHARRMGKMPVVPRPAFIYVTDYASSGGPGPEDGISNIYISRQEIRPSAPKVLSDGRTLEFEVAWTYIIEVPDLTNIISGDEETGPGSTNGFAVPPIHPAIQAQISDPSQYFAENAVEMGDEIAKDGKVIRTDDPVVPDP